MRRSSVLFASIALLAIAGPAFADVYTGTIDFGGACPPSQATVTVEGQQVTFESRTANGGVKRGTGVLQGNHFKFSGTFGVAPASGTINGDGDIAGDNVAGTYETHANISCSGKYKTTLQGAKQAQN